ncbi:hypothetical protein B6U90_00260 [Thermoplasmatales archaeon ex4484_6]|nr:MAG: hypothetical protein B6U90_00260 [Thermoplasmatales archaeon ex4484_6]RLF67561.1 MAG: hypothetical protein DRN57_05525 [Thermoplasmata archaeon]
MEKNSRRGRNWDAVVVGAGPVGSYVSYRLSSLGYSVLLVDRKSEAGRPMHCGGLVNASLYDLEGLAFLKERTVLRAVRGADIYSPSGSKLPLTGKDVKAFSIDRALFDLELLRLSVRKGTETMMSSTLQGMKNGQNSEKELRISTPKGRVEVLTDLVIGCDGPASTVRQLEKLDNPRETVPGVSIEVEAIDGRVPEDRVAVLTGERTAKGFFAWAIPSFGDFGLRIGLSAISGAHFREGMKRLFNDERLADFLSLGSGDEMRFGELSRVFGAIPMGQGKRTTEDGVVLLGDSAGMAKPTSGGGIYPGLKAADLLAAILKDPEDSMTRNIRKFNMRWRKEYGRELTKSMLLRNMFRKLEDREMDVAISALTDRRKLELINETGDIDHPISLAVRLLRDDPSLMMIVPRLLPSLRKLL